MHFVWVLALMCHTAPCGPLLNIEGRDWTYYYTSLRACQRDAADENWDGDHKERENKLVCVKARRGPRPPADMSMFGWSSG